MAHIIVNNLDEANAAIHNMQGESLTIENSPQVIHYAGFAYVKAMLDELATKHNDKGIAFILNVDDNQEAAMLAIKRFNKVKFNGNPQIKEKIKQMASKLGSELI